jgi:tetratricopeptide (TPR) repeat protein
MMRPLIAAHGGAATILSAMQKPENISDRTAGAPRRGRAAMSQSPSADALHQLAVAACRRGDFALAKQAVQQILLLNANDLGAWLLLSGLYAQSGDLQEALHACQRAIAIDPRRPDSFMELAGLHAQLYDFAAVENACRRAVALRPDWADAHVNLGSALFRQSLPEEAKACFHRAIALQPNHVYAWKNLAAARRSLADYAGAIAAYRTARIIAPDFAEAWRDEALMHLMLGDFQTGWPQYEWRWRVPVRGAPNIAGRVWNGAHCPNETVLLHCEQGLGDTIQFLRYVPLVAARAGRVILCVPATLRRIAESIDADVQVLTIGDVLPAFDSHAYLMSLPALFATTPETIPSAPYLQVLADDVASWKQRMLSIPRPRVGLVWAGNPAQESDAQRSMPLAALDVLRSVPGVTFVGLQYPPVTPSLPTDLAPSIADFTDTAAILEDIDLLIAVDTATAHLAGALGRPVWVLLAFVADWRWFLDRDDSPWYPTMRLFRQRQRGDWEGVVTRVAAELQRWLAAP